MMRRLLALLLALALTGASAGAASMEHFTPDTAYPGFTDVAGDAWYAESVRTAVALGIMEGRGGGVFAPADGLTLAEAVTMAARVRARYEGGGFPPGGTPWYRNAADYAVAHGIVGAGEYTDYTRKASRADMAGLFAYCLPLEEYERTVRLGTAPGVGPYTPYADSILQLYSAGIVTGDGGTGAFRPHDGVTRAEAAAIITRVALPAERRRAAVPTPPPGQVAGLDDGTLRLNVPPGWTVLRGSGDELTFLGTGVSIHAVRYEKATHPEWDGLSTLASALPVSVLGGGGDAVLTEPVVPSRFHGLGGYSFRYERGAGAEWTGYLVYLVENRENYYILTMSNRPDCTEAQWEEALTALYSLDLAL